MHLLAKQFVIFGSDDWGFLEERAKTTFLIAPMSPPNSPTLFLWSHLYSMVNNNSGCEGEKNPQNEISSYL
jgi:hypothetical protein